MNREAWQATVHGVAKRRTRLSDQAQHNSFIVYELIKITGRNIPEHFHALDSMLIN